MFEMSQPINPIQVNSPTHAILVVEDDEQHGRYISHLLESEGYVVTVVSNGNFADRALESHVFDLLITDIVMPEKEGIELIREVHRSHPELPIIGMSGGGQHCHLEYLGYASLLGASRVFSKPINDNELLDSVCKLIHKNNK
jgi:CheY-like chemotaxis protein